MDQISPSLKAGVAMGRGDFRHAHSLGQNFIMDEHFLEHLLDMARLDGEDNVLEIGPGPGIMTSLMADRAKTVTAVEADERLEPVLKYVLEGKSNVNLLFGDALKIDMDRVIGEAFNGTYRVIANLPYYITADLIMKMLATTELPDSICIMVQKEAAERLMSAPGDKNWCALAAIVQYFCSCTVLEDVPRTRFDPEPHVDSCFVRLDIENERLIDRESERAFVRLIRSCFAMRRKTLANNLKAAYSIGLEEAVEVITAAGFTDKVRGETLAVEQLADLFKAMKRSGIIR